MVFENYRLAQRVLIAKALYKSGFRQQVVEIYHNNRISSSVFFVSRQVYDEKTHILFDYILVLIRILPKLVLHIFLSKGSTLWIGKNIEYKFTRFKSKTQ